MTDTSGQSKTLRRGWTTGACATAACHAACLGLIRGALPESVRITLPRGERPEFTITDGVIGDYFATASVEKDAGDDPDVTHGALISVRLERNTLNYIRFFAGEGVGTVTLPGLPIAVGEPAINPVPRQMMTETLQGIAQAHGDVLGWDVTVSVRDGEKLAAQTWNGRLGIVGGLSILGTTGIVRPYSCAAWIHSIHRGVDVARARGRTHVAACTGATSERAVRDAYQLEETDMLDMGDFVGPLLKYLRSHPLPRLTLGGGFGKFCKLAQGHLDLHSKRSQVDFEWLSQEVSSLHNDRALAQACREANSALEVLNLCEERGVALAERIAEGARQTAQARLASDTRLDVMVCARDGRVLARSEP
ncbi:MAG: cobalt-precorrin-5B (C(1))-methyltransferase [Pseudomonadota bacterium]